LTAHRDVSRSPCGTAAAKRRVVLAGAVLFACLGSVAPAHAQPCACDSSSSTTDPGVLYRDARPPSFDEIVHMLAPVLWFSPDEPLLLEGIRAIPSAHPCDAPASGAVVYYQVAEVVLRGERLVTDPPQDDPDFFDKVRHFSLRFFFYYPRDVGMGGHEHDIEGAEFEVALDREPDGCSVVRLLLVKASAHGQPWYANRLRPAAGTHYPITLLVEEGKHASCPDRNGDGQFTPGYDINQFVNDGWGVRDVFGAGFLFTGNYAAYMTKARNPASRILPPVDAPPPCIPARLSSLGDRERSLGRYELRSGAGLGLCDAMGTGRDSSFLAVMMRVNGLGAGSATVQQASAFDERFVRTVSGAPEIARRVAVRWDERELGLTFDVMGINAGEGWLVGRLHVLSGVSTELMFIRSASRWSDGYFLGGWEWKNSFFEQVNGVRVETQAARSLAVWESGVRLRVGLPEGPIRWLFMNQRLAGIRTGIRFNGVDRLRNARLTIEFGSGLW